jgi:hypothetical protein
MEAAKEKDEGGVESESKSKSKANGEPAAPMMGEDSGAHEADGAEEEDSEDEHTDGQPDLAGSEGRPGWQIVEESKNMRFKRVRVTIRGVFSTTCNSATEPTRPSIERWM